MTVFSFGSVTGFVNEIGVFTDELSVRSAEGWSLVEVSFEGNVAVALLSRPVAELVVDLTEPGVVPGLVPDGGPGLGAEVALGGGDRVVMRPAPGLADPGPESLLIVPAPEPDLSGIDFAVSDGEGDGDEFDLSDFDLDDSDGDGDSDGDSDGDLLADWYPDPAGRFEQRFWDGNTWTEHVADADGHQQIDPPVA